MNKPLGTSLCHVPPKTPGQSLALSSPAVLTAFQSIIYLLALLITSRIPLEPKLQRQESVSVLFRAVSLTLGTVPST